MPRSSSQQGTGARRSNVAASEGFSWRRALAGRLVSGGISEAIYTSARAVWCHSVPVGSPIAKRRAVSAAKLPTSPTPLRNPRAALLHVKQAPSRWGRLRLPVPSIRALAYTRELLDKVQCLIELLSRTALFKESRAMSRATPVLPTRRRRSARTPDSGPLEIGVPPHPHGNACEPPQGSPHGNVPRQTLPGIASDLNCQTHFDILKF